MGIMYCFEVGFFFALTLISGSFSTQLLAANQIMLQYMGTGMAIIFSIAQAMTVRMGHLIGAKEIAATTRVKNTGICLSLVFMSVWGIALPSGYFFATHYHLGGPGLWWGMTIGAGFSTLLLWWRFKSLSSAYLGDKP
ncbi:MAG: MATE family efflux transporter [Gammaproteobacteria bacterium]|nr:MATE family efflux transporter [Gammaproteobacteria bacterium]